MKLNITLLSLLLLLSFSICAQLVTHPGGVRIGSATNDDYTVSVSEVGGEWQDLYGYNVK